MKWIKFILGLCDHKWKIIRTGRIIGMHSNEPVGTYYDLQCEHCGDVKVRNIR